MKQLLFLLLCCSILLQGCNYRFGEASSDLKGRFYIDVIENRTSYRLFASDLQSQMVRAIRRHKSAQLSNRESADFILSGTITSVQKVDKEIEALTGRVIESQFVINFELTMTEKDKDGEGGEEKKYNINNVTFKNSSGTFRIPNNVNPGQPSTEERVASSEAIKDLAEAVFLSLSGAW